MKTTFTDLIYDTLMGNTQYPQLNFNKVNDQWCDAKNNEITIKDVSKYCVFFPDVVSKKILGGKLIEILAR